MGEKEALDVDDKANTQTVKEMLAEKVCVF